MAIIVQPERTPMQRARWVFLILIAALAAYLALWPVPIDPAAVAPIPNPGLTGPFAPDNSLAAVKHLVPGVGLGPEDVTRGPDGFFYSGLQDGRIVRFRDGDATAETFVSTGGRPLGVQFDAAGNLVVADAFRGLLSVAPDRAITVLTDSVAGERMVFPNGLDISTDGTIWFSDASRRFDQHRFMLDFLEMRPTGRLLSYNPKTHQTTVRLEGLMFANGVALGPGENFVLVNETMRARIARLWLSGPNAGRQDVFLDNLPGYPDNLSYNKRGTFWVAFPAVRSRELESLWPHSFLRKLALRLPERWTIGRQQPLYGMVIGFDATGKVVANLQDPDGGYGSITSVNEFDGKLYLGSIRMTSVGQYSLR